MDGVGFRKVAEYQRRPYRETSKKIKKVLDKMKFKCYNTIREREMREIEYSQIGLQLKVVREHSSFISKVLSKL